MDLDLTDIAGFLHSAARSVGAEVTSPWLYLQLGLILAGGGIAFAAGATVRSRVDLTARAASWPAPLRLFMQVLVDSASTAVFAVLMRLTRLVMVMSTWPSRSYLLSVSFKLALAWLSAWLVAALSIIGQLDPAIDALDSVSSVLGGLQVTPLLVIKLAVLLVLALWLSNIVSNFVENRITQSSDLTPSIQVLLVKMIRLALMIFSVAIVMSAVGINLSVLAI